MRKATCLILFFAILAFTSGNMRDQMMMMRRRLMDMEQRMAREAEEIDDSDEKDLELPPAFGRIRTVDQLLESYDQEKERRSPYPKSGKHECSKNYNYGCNHRQPGEYGLIAPCCSNICCHEGETNQFGICRPVLPCSPERKSKQKPSKTRPTKS